MVGVQEEMLAQFAFAITMEEELSTLVIYDNLFFLSPI